MTWRPVPGFPGYEACARGRGVRGPRGAILAEELSDSGYRKVKPMVRGRRRSLLVHVAVLLAHLGPRPSRKHHGAHLDGRKESCELGNLAWKTRRANEADKRRHGTAPTRFAGRVHKGPAAEALARVVRGWAAGGESYARIAAALGMHRHSVSRIARGLRHAG